MGKSGEREWGLWVGCRRTTLNCFLSPLKVKEITSAKGDNVMHSGLLAKPIKPKIAGCFGAIILMEEGATKWSYWCQHFNGRSC